MAECLSWALKRMEEDIMSLISKSMKDCELLEVTEVSDGEGGSTNTYTVLQTFPASITTTNRSQEKSAEKAVSKSTYNITTPRDVTLKYHDIIRRVDDDKVFRITSDGDDMKTPTTSTLKFTQVTGEEWELP